MVPTLSTPRLRLRPLVADDVAAIFAIFSDPEVIRYWSSPPLADLAAAAALIERNLGRLAEGSRLQWSVVRVDDDQVIGTAILADIDLAHHRADLGYALMRHAWGQGFALEAVRALVEFAFGQLELHRLGADVDPRNDRSLRLLEGLGFAREGLQREVYLVGDEWQDGLLLGLLRRDWLARLSAGGSAPAAADGTAR